MADSDGKSAKTAAPTAQQARTIAGTKRGSRWARILPALETCTSALQRFAVAILASQMAGHYRKFAALPVGFLCL